MGGAKQVAQSFLHELNGMDENIEFHVFLSEKMKLEIQDESFKSNFIFYSIQNKPKPSYFGKKLRIELDHLEAKIAPNLVFSVFGPVYWRPKSPHIAGFAAGWAINPNSIAYSVLDVKTRIKIKLTNWVKLHYINRKEADKYFVETEVVKELFAQHSKTKLDDIFVASNTFGDQYNGIVNPHPVFDTLNCKDFFKFITISANYPHKNLISIKTIVPLLKEKGLKVKFFVTLSTEDYDANFSELKDNVINLGIIKSVDCPAYYKGCDALYLPTLLESFTASYPEAMKMKVPILTSDLDFARNICDEAALYCDTLNPVKIVDAIESLISSEDLRNDLIGKGIERLKHFDSASERAKKYLDLALKFAKK